MAEALLLSPAPGPGSFTVRAYLHALRDDPAFADTYGHRLREMGLSAFYWEHPPVSLASLDHPARVALLPAPALAGRPEDPEPFAKHFERCGARSAVRFANLGGDAELVAPCPGSSDTNHAHLGVFLSSAPAAAQRAFWRETAASVLARVDDDPLWFSTSGLGVSWLHARIERTPKYIQHRPFRTPA